MRFSFVAEPLGSVNTKRMNAECWKREIRSKIMGGVSHAKLDSRRFIMDLSRGGLNSARGQSFHGFIMHSFGT
jgi:hypothetical protein